MSSGNFWIAPASDPDDRYAAGVDDNHFATREEAEEAIESLQTLGVEWNIEWVVNEDVWRDGVLVTDRWERDA